MSKNFLCEESCWFSKVADISPVEVDKFCDYLPLVSTITNLATLLMKMVCSLIENYKGRDLTVGNRYFSYIHNDKKAWRCAVLLIPVFGNLYIFMHPEESVKRAEGTKLPEGVKPKEEGLTDKRDAEEINEVVSDISSEEKGDVSIDSQQEILELGKKLVKEFSALEKHTNFSFVRSEIPNYEQALFDISAICEEFDSKGISSDDLRRCLYDMQISSGRIGYRLEKGDIIIESTINCLQSFRTFLIDIKRSRNFSAGKWQELLKEKLEVENTYRRFLINFPAEIDELDNYLQSIDVLIFEIELYIWFFQRDVQIFQILKEKNPSVEKVLNKFLESKATSSDSFASFLSCLENDLFAK